MVEGKYGRSVDDCNADKQFRVLNDVVSTESSRYPDRQTINLFPKRQLLPAPNQLLLPPTKILKPFSTLFTHLFTDFNI